MLRIQSVHHRLRNGSHVVSIKLFQFGTVKLLSDEKSTYTFRQKIELKNHQGNYTIEVLFGYNFE